jgi:hypothetical protein
VRIFPPDSFRRHDMTIFVWKRGILEFRECGLGLHI